MQLRTAKENNLRLFSSFTSHGLLQTASRTIRNHKTLGGTPLKNRSMHLLVRRHQATDESRNETAAHGANILGNEPNGGAHLTRDTDGQLGVGVGLVLGAARSDEVVVDVRTLHSVENVE